MPEGDSAYRAAANLHRSLAGRVVDRFELRTPKLATASLVGERILGANSRGKHILLRIGDYTVQSHFGMDGSWRLVPPRPPEPATHTRRRRGPTTAWPAAHRIRAIVGTDAVIALGIDLAKLDLWPTSEEEEHLGWLGPDLLGEDPDLDEATRRIQHEPDREISAALLDQRNIAGLGNEYVTEICFLRSVLPSRHVADCGDIAEWVALGRRLLLANRDRVGRTFTGNLNQPTYVFGRGGQPCRRCGTIILDGKHASGSNQPGATERNAAWCPSCQR
ncbi:DNA-formamidopyrimidine glycosylase family protein [Gulosibacter molinativorax]|uniref:DNA-(apurinic or apyrimidinic site) lyase n=1 Tax=Gulosibacter molinativorax TaxID=256821 RepID=A0ABT7CAP1_9MICO|nr:DNA-formamidopyrimidine glycosylase family protein [Gulosibacter molinativorax]MDJ1372276.1 DNA glycosylase [Gulosibacter molinativorax]QUY63439.1 Endonuclease 8 [Gulosibacter molinativorax]